MVCYRVPLGDQRYGTIERADLDDRIREVESRCEFTTLVVLQSQSFSSGCGNPSMDNNNYISEIDDAF